VPERNVENLITALKVQVNCLFDNRVKAMRNNLFFTGNNRDLNSSAVILKTKTMMSEINYT